MRHDPRVPAPPVPPGFPVVLAGSSLRLLTVAQMTTELERILGAAQRMPASISPVRADNGSLRVPSILGVWLLSQVGRAVARPRLVNLRAIDGRELRSTAGIARLVCAAVSAMPSAALVAAG